MLILGEIDQDRLRNSMLESEEWNDSGMGKETNDESASDIHAAAENSKTSTNDSEDSPARADKILSGEKREYCPLSQIYQPTPSTQRACLYPLIYCCPNGKYVCGIICSTKVWNCFVVQTIHYMHRGVWGQLRNPRSSKI